MASGVCVVSTNVGALKQLLIHKREALLVASNDTLQMASAIRRLLADPALAERLACEARRKVERFDRHVVLPQWDALLGESSTC